MKVAIVGCGLISDIHLKAATSYSGAQVVGLADKDIARARTQAARFSIRQATSELGDLLAQQPDVVHVLTPPASHESVTIAALEAGAHVYVEKPMAISEAACERMTRAAVAANRQLCIGHCWVYSPAMRQASELLSSGKAGAVVQAAASFNFDLRRSPNFGSGHWSGEMPGGLAEDVAIHPLSALIHVLGAPHRTYALNRGAIADDGRPPDVRALVEGERGLGTLALSFRARPDLAMLDLWCERMLLRLNISSMTLTTYRQLPFPRKISLAMANLDVASQLVGATIGTAWRLLRRKVDGSYGIVPLVHAFYAAIEAGQSAPVGPAEGQQAVRVLRSIWPLASTSSSPALGVVA
ncbi:MAG TPA: Gfo/Idh/MocA family oxidoreductase [Steroidobacteraceae bacterium]|nr:Gfo/Idh/MocA family oxidoreductase [Steroidobacteraceae bacterium]